VSGEQEEPLAVAERERAEYLALAQRTQADFENFRKRAAKEAAAAGERAKSGFARELLPVVDNLERALESAEDEEEHLASGVRLVHSELVAVLQRNGVEPFDPKGEKFDPTFHEALSTREEDGAGAGVVLDVVEKGYRLNGSVLRPARVVVSG
jgi:molecular chaperone GrpE